MKQINEELVIGYDPNGMEIKADRLQKWAYNQLAAAPNLLEACKRALPWMGKLIAENLHLQCVKPTDAEKTLTLLQQAIAKTKGGIKK